MVLSLTVGHPARPDVSDRRAQNGVAAHQQAARAIAERLAYARRLGLWHPRRNDVDADLAALQAGGTA